MSHDGQSNLLIPKGKPNGYIMFCKRKRETFEEGIVTGILQKILNKKGNV